MCVDKILRAGSGFGIWNAADCFLSPCLSFQIVFEAIRGSSVRSDTAIDDIILEGGHCPGQLAGFFFFCTRLKKRFRHHGRYKPPHFPSRCGDEEPRGNIQPHPVGGGRAAACDALKPFSSVCTWLTRDSCSRTEQVGMFFFNCTLQDA